MRANQANEERKVSIDFRPEIEKMFFLRQVSLEFGVLELIVTFTKSGYEPDFKEKTSRGPKSMLPGTK